MRRLLLVGLLVLLPVSSWASIGPVLLFQGENTAPCTTGSISPVSGQLVLVSLLDSNHNGPAITGTNGLNVTWTVITATTGLSIFRGTPSSGTAGTLTATAGGAGPGTCRWIVVRFSGVDQTSNEGVVQSANCTGAGTSCTPTLSALTKANDMMVLAAIQSGFPAGTATTCTPKSGYTQIAIQSDTNDVDGTICVQYGFDNTPTATLGVNGVVEGGVELLVSGATRHRVIQE